MVFTDLLLFAVTYKHAMTALILSTSHKGRNTVRNFLVVLSGENGNMGINTRIINL